MQLAVTLLATALGAASAFTAPDASARTSTAMRMADGDGVEPDAGLLKLSKGLNPTIGYWDPLSLADADFWEQGTDATIGFLRQAEVSCCLDALSSQLSLATF